MPDEERALSPIEAYKAIIDELVDRTDGLHEKMIRKHGQFSKCPADEAKNEFVQSLSKRQRVLLAEMIRGERENAIHATLVTFTEWVDLEGLAFTFNGEPMPVDISGTGIFGDYIGRLTGWDWPVES